MFSANAKNPYDFLSHSATSQTISNRINIVKNHFNSSEERHKQDRDQLLNQINQINQEPHEEMKEELELELHFFEHFFDRIHRVSTLLITYSLLENLMAKICKEKSERYQVPESFEEYVNINGYGVPKFKEYLQKHFKADFSENKIEKHWSKICTLNKLRNALAHSEGDLDQYRHCSVSACKSLLNTIKSTKGLSLYSSTIIISEQYVNESFVAVEGLLLRLAEINIKNE